MSAAELLKQERDSITELLAGLSDDQWHAATLCEGWTVADLAAHMVAREDSPLRFVIGEATKGKIGGKSDDLIGTYKARGHQSLLRSLRKGPPLLYRLPGPSAIGNLIENWVHNEDFRRGELQLPRTTPPEVQKALWRMLHVVGRMMLRNVDIKGVIALTRPDGEALAFRVGNGFPTAARPEKADAKIVGEPSEIMLFLLGRKSAAKVAFEGDQTMVAALRGAEMSI